MFDFKDKIAVVTGGETGIGRATVEAFARAGATVTIAGFLEDEGQSVIDGLAAEQLTAEFVKIDVRSEEIIDGAIATILERHGRIDVLVNNASIFDGFCGIVDTKTSLWDKVIATNLRGPFLVSRTVLERDMLARGKGNIINMASIGGLIGGADGLAYTASKFGVIGMTRQMAVDLSDKGIKVNAVCPGVIQTDMRKHSTRILGDEAPPMRGVGVDPDALKRVPMARKGMPMDIANAVMFLASDYSDYIAGQNIVVDGGWTIQ